MRMALIVAVEAVRELEALFGTSLLHTLPARHCHWHAERNECGAVWVLKAPLTGAGLSVGGRGRVCCMRMALVAAVETVRELEALFGTGCLHTLPPRHCHWHAERNASAVQCGSTSSA